MNEAHKAQIDATFEKLHQDAAEGYRRVYDSIQQQMQASNSRGLSGEIAQWEAKKLNQKILRLTDAVKQAAISEMIDCGCKQYLTQAGWTEIQQTAGLPHTELCKVQVNIMQSVSEDELEQQYGVNKKKLATMSIGVAAVMVSLIIPGWSLPVKVLCAAGAIVAVLSGAGAICYDSQKKKSTSKFEHIGKTSAASKAQDSIQLDSLVKQITDSQYERNLKLYDVWLEKVKRALIEECDKLSAM